MASIAAGASAYPGEERSLQQQAHHLLSIAESVTREGWGDLVATHLRQAAFDLLRLDPRVPDEAHEREHVAG